MHPAIIIDKNVSKFAIQIINSLIRNIYLYIFIGIQCSFHFHVRPSVIPIIVVVFTAPNHEYGICHMFHPTINHIGRSREIIWFLPDYYAKF
jgi:hypothetical protein